LLLLPLLLLVKLLPRSLGTVAFDEFPALWFGLVKVRLGVADFCAAATAASLAHRACVTETVQVKVCGAEVIVLVRADVRAVDETVVLLDDVVLVVLVACVGVLVLVLVDGGGSKKFALFMHCFQLSTFLKAWKAARWRSSHERQSSDCSQLSSLRRP
jgi:hypothetical protein